MVVAANARRNASNDDRMPHVCARNIFHNYSESRRIVHDCVLNLTDRRGNDHDSAPFWTRDLTISDNTAAVLIKENAVTIGAIETAAVNNNALRLLADKSGAAAANNLRAGDHCATLVEKKRGITAIRNRAILDQDFIRLIGIKGSKSAMGKIAVAKNHSIGKTAFNSSILASRELTIRKSRWWAAFENNTVSGIVLEDAPCAFDRWVAC